MKSDKYLFTALSILILFIFIASASAADTNATDVLSVDESVNLENNLLSVDNNVKSNELSNDTLKVSNDEVLTAENNNWYVNGSKTASGDGTSDAEAFKTLKEALNAAQADETIMIASGEYKGTNNTGLTISKNLNFIKYGDGEAIFDAESQNRIWEVQATSININGLTFKNGKTQGETDGGAILFKNDISNSNINATFINNEAHHGGAIHVDSGKLFSCNLNGTFINNKATGYFGGAIDIRNVISGKLTGTFINNKAEKNGGAIFCFGVSGNVNGTFINNKVTSDGGSAIQCNGGGSGTLSGTFINNTGGKSAIYISNENPSESYSGTLSGTFINNTATSEGGSAIAIDGEIDANGIIKDSVFINNNIYSKNYKITASNCWFGNNATNYNKTPTVGSNVKLPNWLFLNATSNQTETQLGQNSTITFKLDSYNSTSKTTNLYNASKINAAVSLTQTLGELDKTTALFDEKIIYTAKKPGKASITGKFETVTYTINFKNTRDSITWYVNGSKTSSGNGTSDAEAFKTLKEALNETIDYDTIMIASGEYKGTNNTGLTIDKNLTFIKYGDGEAIFDAESKNGIWYVNATSINITDITFKNGNATSGGALHFEKSLINSNINATFINNTATDKLLGGGAIYIDEDYSGNLTGIFINNTASYCGGAIYCQHLSGNLTGTFINNTGANVCGAVYIFTISGNISGTFINNTENNNPVAIYIYGDSSNPTAKIKDAIFINNNIYSKVNKITAINCWFGNNATNYNATPDAGTNVTLPNWLFLNATADPAEVPLGQNSTITFKLDLYNSTSNTTNSYDASKINAAVSLTQTLGELDKTTALFDEKIIYTAKKGGEAIVTGKFETLEYTINLKNTRDSITWYVNGSKTSSGNGTSEEEAFKTLKEALNETIDYDTIMIASGEYKGTNNTELTIDKNLTIMKYGDGEAIFDAESQRRIWTVQATSINITGLTFKNGNASSSNGGALYFVNSLTNSNINATFINNNAKENGGAIRINGNFSGNVSGIFINNTANHAGAVDCGRTYSNFSGNLTGIFINNTARSYGGAIDFYHLSGNLDGTFINNSAKSEVGGAIYIYNTSGNISGTFINNRDKGGSFAIFIYGDYPNPTAKIKDAVFINNKINVQENKITATNCWFGNNATNYNKTPDAGPNVILPNWLFLNATASPGEIRVNEKSTIEFILESYDENSKQTNPYDASKMNIILNLNQTLGELDKTKTLINKNVSYTATEEGNASVTGKFETAFYTINLKNEGVAIPTNITVDTSSLDLIVGENDTIIASLDPPEAGNLTFTSNDTSIAEVDEYGVVTAKGNGSALITVSFAGNGQYLPAENKTVIVTVGEKPGPIPTVITVDTSSLDLIVGENDTIIASLDPPEAGNLTFTSNDTSIAEVDEYGVVTAKGNGSALITVSFGGNGQYLPAENKTVIVTVSEKPGPIPTNITLNTSSLDLIVGENDTIIASLDPPEAGNLTFTSNDTSIAEVDEYGVVTAKGNGSALITVSFGGNGQYLPAENKTVIVTVGEKPGPIPTVITVDTSSLDLIVGENDTIIASLDPPEAGNLTFTSNDTSIAEVDEYGVVTAKGNGSALITVSFGGNGQYLPAENKTVIVTVSEKPGPIPTNITLNTSSLDLVVGENGTVVASLNPPEAGNLTFTSNDTSIATVDKNGVVTAIANGTALITVSFAGNGQYLPAENKTLVVTVSKKIPVVSASSISFIVGNEGILNIYGPKDVYGYLNVTINNIIHPIIIEGGLASLNVSYLDVGMYSVDIVYLENAKYYQREFFDVAQISVFDKFPTPLNVDDFSVYVGEVAVVNVYGLPRGLNGRNITITINDEFHVAVISDGNASSIFSGLTAGVYDVVVSYAGDNTYKANFTNAVLTVNKLSPFVNASDVEFIVDNEGILNITGPNDRDGYLVVSIGDKIYDVTLINGEVSLDVSDLDIGVYSVDIIYLENDKYCEEEFSNVAQISVVDKYPTPLKVDDLFINVGDDAFIKVYNIPEDLNGKIINITVDGVGSHFAVIDDGVAYSTFSGLTKSSYLIVASYDGDNIYKANSTSAILNVIKSIPKVSAVNSSFIVGNDGVLNIFGPADCVGVLNVTIGNNSYMATLINGNVNLDVSDLGVGYYNVNIVYLENDKYYEWYFANIATVNVLDKKSTPLFVDDLTISVGDVAVVNVYGIPEALDGRNIIITINDESHVAIIIGGNAFSTFSGLTAGVYDVVASYAGDNIYKSNFTNAVLTVNKFVPVVNASDVEFIVDNEGILNIFGPADCVGVLNVTIGNNNYIITLIDGNANLNISDLGVGQYNVSILYLENDMYYERYFEDIATVTVDDKYDTPIVVDDLIISVGDVADVNVTVPRSISGQSISISVNGKIEEVIIIDGMANAKFSDVPYGKYDIVVYYPGDSTHASNMSVATLTVEKIDPVTSINVSDIFVGNNETIIVNVPDDAKGIVLLDVNGKNYIIPVDNGKAVLVLSDLGEGNYTVKYVYDGDGKYLNATGSAGFEVSLNDTYEIKAEGAVIYVREDAVVYVELPEDATGTVTVTVDGEIYSSPVMDGVAVITVSGLTEGLYVADVAYLGDDKYAYSSTVADIVVNKVHDVPISVKADSVNVGDKSNVYVELPKDATGTVSVSVNGKTYTAGLVDGKANINIDSFDVSGKYSGVVAYLGDDKYDGVTSNVTIEVVDKFEVFAPNVVKFYHGTERFNVYVLLNGKAVADKSVSITINGQTYVRTTNNEGLASIGLNLNSGNYTVVVNVDNVSVNSFVTIKPTIVGHDVTKIFRNGTQYYATFYDVDGSVLAYKVVKFNINGVFYYRETDANGVARLNINLPCGSYILTAINPVTGEMMSNRVVVLTHFAEHDDMEKVYGTPTPYAVKVRGDSGRIVGEGVTVSFNINGVFYTRTTDLDGVVRLNINLMPGVYIITSIYRDEMVSDTITVYAP